MKRYSISPQARADLKEIWKYIARHNIDAADRLLDQFLATFHDLALHPHSGQHEPQYRPNLRSRSVGVYVIFFEPREYGICVIRVLHGRRDIASMF